MSRGRQVITFEGLLQKDVLGTFTVIRGFASLADLAEVSVSSPFKPTGALGAGENYQRKVMDSHVSDLERFLGEGRYRFFPEIILGLWSKGGDDQVVSYKKRSQSPGDGRYQVRVVLRELKKDEGGRIHRIDGNHRLEAATKYAKGRREGASLKSFEKASFCFVVLDPDHPQDEMLAEAMLFNLINSKAIPLTSEEKLSILVQDEKLSWAEDKQVYLTKRLRDAIQGWPGHFLETLGSEPLSTLNAMAVGLTRPGGLYAGGQAPTKKALQELCDPLSALAASLGSGDAELAKFVGCPQFLPIAAEVYARHSQINADGGTPSKRDQLRAAKHWLLEFSHWFHKLGLDDLATPIDPLALWALFKRDFDRKPRGVFIAMSFQYGKELDRVWVAVNEAINEVNKAHPSPVLTPVRVDKQRGASYDIPAQVFEDIRESGLVIADLTDERPNVYCEVGYAMSLRIPFILTFRQKKGKKPPWDRGNQVHFDLSPRRYIKYDDCMDLREELKKELGAFFEQV